MCLCLSLRRDTIVHTGSRSLYGGDTAVACERPAAILLHARRFERTRCLCRQSGRGVAAGVDRDVVLVGLPHILCEERRTNAHNVAAFVQFQGTVG
jgi:hypothetical protein